MWLTNTIGKNRNKLKRTLIIRDVPTLIHHAPFSVYGLKDSPLSLILQDISYGEISDANEEINTVSREFGLRYGFLPTQTFPDNVPSFSVTSSNRKPSRMSLDDIRKDLTREVNLEGVYQHQDQEIVFWEDTLKIAGETFHGEVWTIPHFSHVSKFSLAQQNITIHGRSIGFSKENLLTIFSALAPLNNKEDILIQHQQEKDLVRTTLKGLQQSGRRRNYA